MVGRGCPVHHPLASWLSGGCQRKSLPSGGVPSAAVRCSDRNQRFGFDTSSKRYAVLLISLLLLLLQPPTVVGVAALLIQSSGMGARSFIASCRQRLPRDSPHWLIKLRTMISERKVAQAVCRSPTISASQRWQAGCDAPASMNLPQLLKRVARRDGALIGRRPERPELEEETGASASPIYRLRHWALAWAERWLSEHALTNILSGRCALKLSY